MLGIVIRFGTSLRLGVVAIPLISIPEIHRILRLWMVRIPYLPNLALYHL